MKANFHLIPFLIVTLASLSACDVAPDSENEVLEAFELIDIESPCAFDSPDFAGCMEQAENDEHESFRFVYPIDEVIDACENAYSNGTQIAACIRNVCSYYGCEY